MGDKQAKNEGRRFRLSELVLRGDVNLQGHAVRFGVSLAVIRRDLVVLKERWLQAAAVHIDEYIGRELQRLDMLEKAAWDAWDRSQRPRVSKSHEKEYGPPPSTMEHMEDGEEWKGEAAKPDKVLVKEVKKSSSEEYIGDVRYLELAQQCMKDRRELLGLDKPKKFAQAAFDGQSPFPISLRDISNDMLDAVEQAVRAKVGTLDPKMLPKVVQEINGPEATS